MAIPHVQTPARLPALGLPVALTPHQHFQWAVLPEVPCMAPSCSLQAGI